VGHITHTYTQQHSPSSVSPSILHAPLKLKLLLACIVVTGFSATDRHCIAIAAFCANGSAASVVPFIEGGSDTTVGSWEKIWGATHIEARQLHKQERRHTLTQNLKAMSLWVLLLIRCSTFPLLSDVRHITHTCTQQQRWAPYNYIIVLRFRALYSLVKCMFSSFKLTSKLS